MQNEKYQIGMVGLGVMGWNLVLNIANHGFKEGYHRPGLPANLIQAQRDYVGAHTYVRKDQKGVFHTKWGKEAVE